MGRKVDVLLMLGAAIVATLFAYTIIVKPVQLLQDISSRECISGFDAMMLCAVYALWGFFIGFLVFHEMRKRSPQTPNSGERVIGWRPIGPPGVATWCGS